MEPKLEIVILGLSITSSWGNGHATTYRSLLRGLNKSGHRVLFLERDVPWYSSRRDLETVPYAEVALYSSLEELRDGYSEAVRNADLVIVGSFVPDGPAVIEWVLETARGVRAFYDIDTPVTLEMISTGDHRHLEPRLIPKFDLYWSFTAGPMLRRLESEWGARRARPLYCSVDDEEYYPATFTARWSLGYLGTYSDDRQPSLERLLIEPARALPESRFVVAGSMYPDNIAWPENLDRIDHLAPTLHREFYGSQRFTLNITRAAMMKSGYSPSVRLFEAAACGTVAITDRWPGLDEFFEPGEEILVADSGADVVSILRGVTAEKAARIAERARARTLEHHSCLARARDLTAAYLETSAAMKTAVSA